MINSRKLFHPGKYWASVVVEVEALWENTNKAEKGNREIRVGPSDQTEGNTQTLSRGSRTVVLEMCSMVWLD